MDQQHCLFPCKSVNLSCTLPPALINLHLYCRVVHICYKYVFKTNVPELKLRSTPERYTVVKCR
jgi:hypothetical protein